VALCSQGLFNPTSALHLTFLYKEVPRLFCYHLPEQLASSDTPLTTSSPTQS
jgi:hypothetical protein